ncbi:MAG: hypothetical protein WA941_14665 [Nitrososphaeraceae archaeon]
MKLELLTNATVVDDAIKFVASHSTIVEKANSNKMVVVDEENHNHKKQQSSATNNSIF